MSARCLESGDTQTPEIGCSVSLTPFILKSIKKSGKGPQKDSFKSLYKWIKFKKKFFPDFWALVAHCSIVFFTILKSIKKSGNGPQKYSFKSLYKWIRFKIKIFFQNFELWMLTVRSFFYPVKAWPNIKDMASCVQIVMLWISRMRKVYKFWEHTRLRKEVIRSVTHVRSLFLPSEGMASKYWRHGLSPTC